MPELRKQIEIDETFPSQISDANIDQVFRNTK